MPPEDDIRLELARAASADELNTLIYETDEKFLLALLGNPNFQEKHAELLLGRLDISAAILTAISEDRKWMASESIRLKLAQHAHTPKRIAMAAMRQLFLFDLVRLSLLPSVAPDIRRVAEEAILARVPHLPVGEKLTLARRGPARVAGAILAEGHPQAMKLALGNSLLTESQVLRVLAKEGIPERVVEAIATHPKWSCRYNVRVALIRNRNTPLSHAQAFVGDITGRDLKDISALQDLPQEVGQIISAELERRNLRTASAMEGERDLQDGSS
jgi:hypothetical protein